MRAQLLLTASLAATAAAASARMLPAAQQLAAIRSWLAPRTGLRDPTLAPPHLATPPGPDALAVAWDGLPEATTYTLLASDWWSAQPGVSTTAYKGALLATELTERVMPAAPVTLVLVASAADEGAELARSAAVTFSAAESGACGNLADATVWRCVCQAARVLTRCLTQHALRDNWEHLHDDVAGCLEQCGADGGTCTSSCVVGRGLLFSKRCAACWDELHDCAVDHCALPCGFSPKGSKCHSCTESACTPAVAKCHGIPKWAWAPQTHADAA